MKRMPTWLRREAKRFWQRHVNQIPEHQIEGFAIVCETYADYREAKDLRVKRSYLETLLKYLREYKLTPRASGAKVEPPASPPDPLDTLMGGAS
jgi:hypothetical protein